MIGFNPNWPPVLSANGEMPYSITPGRTQSVKASGHAKIPAELAILRSFDDFNLGTSAASVSLNKLICLCVIKSCLSSALAKWVIRLIG